MTEPHDPYSLETLMAAMADGQLPALWTFHETFEGKLRHVVLSHVRSMYRHDVAADRERIDSLTTDAAVVIFERARSWKPGGAAPWNWAGRAIRSMIATEIGHRSVELGNDDGLDGEAGTDAAPVAGGVDLTIDALIAHDPAFVLFAEVYRSVGTARDQEAAWLFRTQKETGDPSPARTVAHHLGLSAANARQVHRRHFARVSERIWSDDRYTDLRDWAWFAA